MTDIHKVVEDIPVYPGPVGVLVSGGADSALLLYLLLSKYKSKVHVFTVAIGTDEQVDVKASVDVVNACVKITGNINVEHHISYEPKNPTQQKKLKRLARKYLDDNTICDLFLGITSQPPAEVVSSWNNQLLDSTAEMRSPEERDPYWKHGFRIPFINLNKKNIAELYNHYDLLESLLPYTKSCIDPNATDSRYHCGECWWCEERKWAFGTT